MPTTKKVLEAEPHTPVYKMHKYFARRPWNVFRELIQQHSSPGDIVLDPFLGGGVTVVESLRLKRKVIGTDVNPLAVFITRMEASPLDLDRFEEARRLIASKIKDEIQSLYLTKCPDCGMNAQADWYEWNEAERKILRIKFDCTHCGHSGIKKPLLDDFALAKRLDDEFEATIQKRQLWFPQTEVPQGDKTNSLLNNGTTHFNQIYTRRNLLALSILLNEIDRSDSATREFLKFTFSSCLKWCSRQSHLRGRIVEGWAMHAYWIYPNSLELNVWNTLERRFDAVIRGKKFSNEEIGDFYKAAKRFEDLKHASCLLLSRSSTNLPVPDNSVDAIITDPPYGANVNYGELADYWWIWLNDGKTIEKEEEAVINRTRRKSIREYEEALTKVFKECMRVLRPGGAFVSTFNSKDAAVVTAFITAASRAGFEIDSKGISYQEPIKAYTTTFHAIQVGAFVGDFIFRFTKRVHARRVNVHIGPEDLSDFKNALGSLISGCVKNELTESQIRESAYKHLIPFIASHSSVPSCCVQATEFFESKMRESSEHFRNRRKSIIEVRRRTFRKKLI